MIVTPDRRVRVFISSTLHELADERAAALAAVEGLRLTPVVLDSADRAHAPRALYRSYIEQSDMFIGIYWQRYGWIALDMEISGIEDEYLLSHGMPRLIYVKDGDPEPRLASLLGRISNDEVSYKRFADAAELGTLIEDDLMVTLTERFYAEEVEQRQQKVVPRLPAQLSTFVGRKREVEELRGLLTDPEVRLVTLIGPGGIGKTRLSLEAAAGLPVEPGGTYFVSLASLRDPQLVPDEIARSLGLTSMGDADPMQQLRDFLASQTCVLILDNFEHLLGAAPVVGELLESAEGLKIVVTSRAALRLRGEHIYEVDPLMLPDDVSDPDRLMEADAIRLFVERANAVRPDFGLDVSNMKAVAEICRKLDGLPLAIELAAAQVRILPPERVLERLSARLTLTGGTRDMPERHQRLRDTIEWSYQLLDENAKGWFALVSAFRGGFTLDAAETVCGHDIDVLQALSTLLDHSLVRNASRGHGEPRFLMLETIREYAAEILAAAPEKDWVHDRHAAYYSKIALDARSSVGSRRQAEVLDRLEDDVDNLRAALTWMLEHDEAGRAAHALLSTWYFWWARNHLREGRRWGLQALEHELDTLGRARALAFEAGMAFWQSDYAAALPAFAEAGELFESEDDPDGLALTEMALGLVEGFLGDFDKGTSRILRAIGLYEESNDRWGVVSALTSLGWLQSVMDRFDDDDQRFRYALDVATDLGSPSDLSMAELNMARYLIHDGYPSDAVPYLESSLDRVALLRHIGGASNVLDAIGLLAAAQQRWRDALVLVTGADAIRATISFQNPIQHIERIRALRERAEAELGREQAAAAIAEGEAMDLERAVEAGRTTLHALARELSPA